jgi:hypothetical protein
MAENDDLRTFIREITLRFERGMDRIVARMDANAERAREESRVYFERLYAQQEADTKADRERLDEILAEGRAGRQALLNLINRLDNGGPAKGG